MTGTLVLGTLGQYRGEMKNTYTLAGAVFVAGLVLAGCSSAQDAPDPEPPVEADQSPQPPAETEADAPDEAGSEDEAAPEPEPAPDDPACLVGEWIITEESMQAFYDSMDTPAEFTVNGETGLEFTDDGTYEYTPGFSLDIDMGGMIASGTLTGSVAGSYEADDAVITTSNEDNDIDLVVTAGGVTMDGSDLGEGFLMSSPINSADYVCTPTGPVLTWQGGSGGLDVSLEPAG